MLTVFAPIRQVVHVAVMVKALLCSGSTAAQLLIRNSKYILKVFGSEIYFTEDVLFLEVPEIVEQLTKSFYETSATTGGPSATLRLVMCDKQRIVEKYNFGQFQESCMKMTELTSAKKELEKLSESSRIPTHHLKN